METVAPVIAFASKREKLAHVEAMARRKMDQVGLSHIPFAFDGATKALGRTHFTVDRWTGDTTLKQVTLSRYWAERLPLEEIEDTIAHECAHALLPYHHKHDAVWEAKCVELGGNGKQYAETHKLADEVRFAWIGTCPNGHTTGEARMPARAFSCSKCSPGRFDPALLFTWKKDGQEVPEAKMGRRYRANLAWIRQKYAA